ncbi:MAG: Fe-S protein assembly co-chaperone HscB [Planctomycetota bacterium]|jgi:molecular chaperone HscB
MDVACSACGAPLQSLLICADCGAVQDVGGGLDPFAVLGLARTFEVDVADLRKRLLRLSRQLHPDFYAGEDESARELATRNSAELNAAYPRLEDVVRRAELLVELGGGPDASEERQMPQAFLMEVMEWNEALEELREGSDADGADALRAELTEQREELVDALGAGLTPLPPEGDAAYRSLRQALNAIRYVDRVLGELSEIRLKAGA